MKPVDEDAIDDAIETVSDQFEAQIANNELRHKLQNLQHAVRGVIYKWRQFDEPTLEQRKLLYDAYIKSGGNVS